MYLRNVPKSCVELPDIIVCVVPNGKPMYYYRGSETLTSYLATQECRNKDLRRLEGLVSEGSLTCVAPTS
jgi:hypothetical protein